MKYSNPEIPEGINYCKDHPLKEFSVLVGGIFALFVVLVLSLVLLSEALAPYIPFSAEQKIAALQATEPAGPVNPIEPYLQQLAEQLAAAEDLADGMSVMVHYVDDNTINAFATLGGHIIVFRGLLEVMPDENTLAMVLAHEIAHIKHRHPIMGLGRGIVLGAAIAMISGAAGNDIVTDVLGNTGLLTVLKFTREQERQADMTALQAMARHYGHVQGADTVFNILQHSNNPNGADLPEFFYSHPVTEQRITAIQKQARQQDWSQTGTVSALPADFKQWLEIRGDG